MSDLADTVSAMKHFYPRLIAVPLAVVVFALAGCAAPSYTDRMAFLDKVNAEGIKYRQELQRQDTQPSEKACAIGWDLLNPDIPTDVDYGDATPKWRDQVREAYVKGCMTGQERPKPDPSGVQAVTPVPIGSEGPRVPRAPSPSTSVSASVSASPAPAG
jgi:hypothetical protein